MAKVHSVMFLSAIAVVFSTVSALSDAEKDAIKAVVLPILEECGKEYDVTKEDIIAAKKAKDIDAVNPCFYACFFKKTGMIDDEGLYAVNVAKENHKKFIKDEELLSAIDSVTDTCSKINEQEVSDGAEGCERAKLLVKCFHDNKESFSPILD